MFARYYANTKWKRIWNKNTWSSSFCSMNLVQSHTFFIVFRTLLMSLSSSSVAIRYRCPLVTVEMLSHIGLCSSESVVDRSKGREREWVNSSLGKYLSAARSSVRLLWGCGSICNLLVCFGAFKVHSVRWFIKNWHESISIYSWP